MEGISVDAKVFHRWILVSTVSFCGSAAITASNERAGREEVGTCAGGGGADAAGIGIVGGGGGAGTTEAGIVE